MITQEAITSSLVGSAPVHHLVQIAWAPGDITYVTHTKTSVYSIHPSYSCPYNRKGNTASRTQQESSIPGTHIFLKNSVP